MVEEAPRYIGNDVLLRCSGRGAILDDARKVLTVCLGGQGLYGASHIERLPMKETLIPQTTRFKR
ncbi:hypothetical protein Tasa_009_058 [Tanticharoenia sakaeratensis NBRC 103193]|uniref:Uncharacterized protein n=1 Tax=Tanticharoenia sakaeratensis NBRC 103193 TaxID=1231623 RepID=A0A0D6MJ31_9PROT|nr:hypothetical protein Tasa_009_058 [Tanticharoenia sakaeratensis NBRC 103193]GBQ21148.1 hypothetical protein AA103193_1630 [Tanticharoenia sakaeratensis NBRC 103193]